MTATDAAAAPMTRLNRAFILMTLTMVTMLYAMTVTIANVALPKMQGSLSATQDQIAWVVTFNIVAAAVATPMSGWLAARLGRRNLMIFAVIGFAAASVSKALPSAAARSCSGPDRTAKLCSKNLATIMPSALMA